MHSYANRSLVNCGGSIAMPVKPASAARAATKRGVDPLKGSCSRNLPLPMEFRHDYALPSREDDPWSWRSGG